MKWKHWFKDKELTTNWLGNEAEHWFVPLAGLVDKECKVLEIGSYEGRSAICFLEYLPKCHLTAVDIFIDPDVEGRFDRNIAPYGNRVTKIKGRGQNQLDLMLRKETFDVIYLDTGKWRDMTFANTAAAWPLLNVGGVFIWDDLQWGKERAGKDRPHDGIWQFCLAFEECIEYQYEGLQMIVRKVKDWPTMPKVEKISQR